MSMKKNSTTRKLVDSTSAVAAVSPDLLTAIRTLIDQARDATARVVNSALMLLYWSIGDRIRRDILQEKRAEYGKQIVGALSRHLATGHPQPPVRHPADRRRSIRSSLSYYQTVRDRVRILLDRTAKKRTPSAGS